MSDHCCHHGEGHQHHNRQHHAPQQAAAPTPAPLGARYTCPMHPEIVRDGPGSCPKCGLALEPLMPSGALYPFTGLLLSPMAAAAAMSLSSVSVISSSLRLRMLAAPQQSDG